MPQPVLRHIALLVDEETYHLYAHQKDDHGSVPIVEQCCTTSHFLQDCWREVEIEEVSWQDPIYPSMSSSSMMMMMMKVISASCPEIDRYRDVPPLHKPKHEYHLILRDKTQSSQDLVDVNYDEVHRLCEYNQIYVRRVVLEYESRLSLSTRFDFHA